MNYDRDNYYDQEVLFEYEGQSYCWQGDYSVTNWGEDESDSAPAYGETEVTINHTTTLEIFDEPTNDWFAVKPTPSLLAMVEITIEKTL